MAISPSRGFRVQWSIWPLQEQVTVSPRCWLTILATLWQHQPCSLFSVSPPLAEANAINENTDTLHLSPQINTEYVGQSSEKRPEVCERSCEELGSMINELSGLHVIVNQLHENLRKVVSAWAQGREVGPTPYGPVSSATNPCLVGKHAGPM